MRNSFFKKNCPEEMNFSTFFPKKGGSVFGVATAEKVPSERLYNFFLVCYNFRKRGERNENGFDEVSRRKSKGSYL